MLNEDERRELDLIEAALEDDSEYATPFAFGADGPAGHDPRPWPWTRIALVAALFCVAFLVTGVPSLALVATAVVVAALGVRLVAALRT
jgi:hypothetical protein